MKHFKNAIVGFVTTLKNLIDMMFLERRIDKAFKNEGMLFAASERQHELMMTELEARLLEALVNDEVTLEEYDALEAEYLNRKFRTYVY